MKKIILYASILFLLATVSVNAQVTIGSQVEPHPGAVLDLQSQKGLKLPVVSINNVNTFQLSTERLLEAAGMIVYNSNSSIAGGQGKGVYVWDGTKWMFVAISGGVATPVTRIRLASTGGVTSLISGETLQFLATVEPANATNNTITWSVAPSSGGSITQDGLFTAGNTGTVAVRATANDGSNVYEVFELAVNPAIIPVTGVTVASQDGTNPNQLNSGSFLQLTATVLPSDASNKAVTWSVSSGNAATVSSTGLVTCTGNGAVTIRATSQANNAIYGEYSLNIVTAVTRITLTSTGGVNSLMSGQNLQFMAMVEPANASNKTITWSVVPGSGSGSITQDGLFTAGNVGTVTIRATANDGSNVYGVFEFTVTPAIIPVTGVTVVSQDRTNPIQLNSIGSLQLAAIVSPSNATNPAVTWSVPLGGNAAIVSSTGLVNCIGNGAVTIRATSQANNAIYGEYSLTIVTAVSRITLSGGVSSLMSGQNLQFMATVEPANASNKTISWSVIPGSGSGSITQDGFFTAGNAGTVTVCATANDGSNVYGVFDITITPAIVPVTGVMVVSQDGTNPTQLNSGNFLQLAAIVSPSNATNPAVTWSISSGNATVSSTGLVTCTGNGAVTIRATSQANNAIYGEYSLTIVTGPGTVTGNSGFTYATYCYPDHLGCWTDNIKEAGQNQTTYPGHSVGERGYYYAWSNAAGACGGVPGYSLPTAEQFGALQSYFSGSASDAEKDIFRSGLAGHYITNTSTWASWGTGQWWCSRGDIQQQYFSSDGSSLWGPLTVGVRYQPVRCIKSN